MTRKCPRQPPRERRRQWGAVAWGHLPQPPSLLCSRRVIRHSAKSEMNCPSSLDFEACETPRVPWCQAPLQLLQKSNVCWVIKGLFCHYNNQPQMCTGPSIVCRNKWGKKSLMQVDSSKYLNIWYFGGLSCLEILPFLPLADVSTERP